MRRYVHFLPFLGGEWNSYNIKFIIFKWTIQQHLVHSAVLYIHHIYLASKHFNYSQNKALYPLSCYSQILPPSSPWQLPVHFLCQCSYLFWIFHTNGNIKFVIFSVWHLTLSIMFSRFTFIIAWINSSFPLWLSNVSLYAWTIICSSTHSLMNM